MLYLHGQNICCIIKYILKVAKRCAVFGKKKRYNYKIGLALSGGGTRGFAHLGVFRALEEWHIPVHCVAGTSVGSIMGAMYSAGLPWQTILEEARTLTKKDILNKRFAIGSDSANIEEIAERLLGKLTFDKLKLPFAAVAVDIATGNEVVLTSGEVSKAVSASSAVPALFTPVKMGDMVLVDGGLLNNMPADVCRKMGADVVISVDLNHTRGKGTTSTKLLDILIATWNITTKGTVYKGEINSDVIITPELSAYKNTRLENIDEMVSEGYRAAAEKMPDIMQILQTKF